MSEREPQEGESGPEGPQPEEKPQKNSTHLRPLPSPQPDERLFATPAKPPVTRPRPAQPEPGPPSRPRSAQEPKPVLPPERVRFPVAKPPPGIPVRPPPAPTPPPEHPEREEEQELEIATALDVGDAEAAEVEAQTTRRSSLYGYVLYLALALGTFPLPGEVRYTLLWTMLVGLGGALLLFDEGRPLSGPVDPVKLTWGLGVGFVLGLPIMLTASHALARTSQALVPVANVPALFQALVITWPLGETLFYRGAVQREYGLGVAALAAGLGNMLLYWPETGGVFAVLFVAVSFATALAFVYGYVRRQYGLAAAYACQVMTSLMLIFLPRLLVPGG